jgi:hypothetical protein
VLKVVDAQVSQGTHNNHGARAERQGFNITLERSFDPAAGDVDLFPQEITRALLNLISNGFYAATKRKAEANGGDYEPTLAAATKNLGDRVEIRILYRLGDDEQSPPRANFPSVVSIIATSNEGSRPYFLTSSA